MASPQTVKYTKYHRKTLMFRIRNGDPLRIGLNYRLAYGWDFGADRLGLADPARLSQFEADCQRFQASGITMLRWFVANDGRIPIHAPALTNALDTAARHGLGLLLVLLDHHYSFRHGARVKDPNQFENLLFETLVPIIDLAGRHPATIGFELMNEPEMAMRARDWPLGRRTGVGCPECDAAHQLTTREMRQRIERTRDIVHRRTDKQFSVGSMHGRWAGQWLDCLDPSRDFLNFHFYGDVDLDELMRRWIQPLSKEIPTGFGEFYPLGRVLETARRYNLPFALPWVWNPGPGDPGAISLEEMSMLSS